MLGIHRATLRKKLPYDTQKDLAGVTQLFNMQLAIVARPDAPFNNAFVMPGALGYEEVSVIPTYATPW